MYRSLNLNEDLALKQVVTDRFSLTDRGFAWREVLSTEKRSPVTDITITRGTTDSHFSLEDVEAVARGLAAFVGCELTPATHPSTTEDCPR